MSETAINDGANDRIRDMAQEIYQSLVTDIAAGDPPQSSLLLLDATLRQFRHDTIAELLKGEAQLQASGHYLPGLAAAPDIRTALRDLVTDLEERSNIKLGDQKGVLDCGNGVYRRAVIALLAPVKAEASPDRAAVVEYVQAAKATETACREQLISAYQRLRAAWVALEAIAQEGRDA